MVRRMAGALVLGALAGAVFAGCDAATGDAAGEGTGAAEESYVVFPPAAGVGARLRVRLDAARPTLEFGATALDLGEGITVESVTVQDSYGAVADIVVAPDAVLGKRDAVVTIYERTVTLPGAFEVIADSFKIEPDSAKMGQIVEVALVGKNTEWQSGYTWASFGEGVEVADFRVLSKTLAVATVAVRPDAPPGRRDVEVENGPAVLSLIDGFIVDRAVITATFEPGQAWQGTSVDFTIRGVDTTFAEGTTLQFWDDGGPNADIQVTTLTVLDNENLFGQLRLSNAAAIGLRDVRIKSTDDLFLPDALEVLDSPPDLSNVAVGLQFDVDRQIDDTTGAASDVVTAVAYFIIPLNPPCGSGSFGAGPMPYDVNGVFPNPQPPAPVDCPNPETVSAGDQVWFESDENIVTLDKDVIAETGQVIYRGYNLTLNDYRFGQTYDLRAPGDPDGVPAFLVEDVQPTVPADYTLLSPDLGDGFVQDRTEPFDYSWTPAQTYPDAIFSTGMSGTLSGTGEGGFAGCLPWDDGEHTYGPNELLQLSPGPVSFTMASYIEGRYFGLPFSSIQTCQSDSTLATTARLTLQ
jgi:hypothetical protein